MDSIMIEKKFKELVVHATEEVFEKMIMSSISLKENEEFKIYDEGHITASIGFAGQWDGFISIQCGESLAYLLAAQMLYADVSSLDGSEMRDALGEIVNMIGGKFKACFSETFNQGVEAFKMSVPSVITGKNYDVYAVGSDSMLEILFQAHEKQFFVELALKQIPK